MSNPAIDPVRAAVLDLHQALITVARRNYERVNGQIGAGKLLELLISDPQFKWLRPFSKFIVSVDELLEQPELTSADLDRLSRELDALLSLPEYLEVLQREPEVLVSHGMLRDALDASGENGLKVKIVDALDPAIDFPPGASLN